MSVTISDLIRKKRDGQSLTTQEIQKFVDAAVQTLTTGCQDGVTACTDSQIGAMLMAMYLRGLNDHETCALTRAMASSGEILEWPEEWRGDIVDKQSTGGVGDKVSHVLVPALAACGLKVPMLTGRSLDITGGTLDKLESIPGFQVSLSKTEMVECLRNVGCFIAGQTSQFVPADRILYRTRDFTATSNSIPLITASILSKKIAESLSALVFDVKYGKGAKLKSKQEARELAEKVVASCSELGIKSTAFLTTMDAPLGKMIGNAVEIVEVLSCLHGGGPPEVLEIVETLGGELLSLTGKVPNLGEGSAKIQQVLQNGAALRKFQQMLVQQGVAESIASELCEIGTNPWSILPRARHITKFTYDGEKRGQVEEIDAEVLGRVWKEELDRCGGTNHAVGVELTVQQGDILDPGDVWVRVHHDQEELSETQVTLLKGALRVGLKSRVRETINSASRRRQRKTTTTAVYIQQDGTADTGVCYLNGTVE